MKVLLFSNDTMPFGSLPTSGGGLRCWQLYQGLKSQGIEVIASMPSFTFLTKKYFSEIPPDVRENLWEWHTQDDIFERVKPDAVLYSSNWDHYNLSSKPDVPLIIDLHGSRLIETSLWGETPDINKKLETFSKADCLLAAGEKQKMYFYGWLLQAGRIPSSEHFIRHIPISLSPDKFERINTPQEEYPLFVSGGGWFPWQDQSSAIFGICNEVTKRNLGILKIFGTPHENPNPTEDELKIRSIYARVKEISENNSSVKVQGYVGRDQLLAEYKKASVAVELMKYNLERELAFTTRTIEYLWCGLPVLYNNYSEISKHISEYDAGWTIDPENEAELAKVLEEIYSDTNAVRRKSENAQNLVKDRFSWDKTIDPLVDFLKHPAIIKPARAVKGFSFNSSPYLSPKGQDVRIELSGDNKIIQEFIYPTEGIWAIQLSVEKVVDPDSCYIHCVLKNSFGLKVGSYVSSLEDLNKNPQIFVTINRILRPSGGSIGKIEVELKGKNKNSKVVLKGLSQISYPLKSSQTIQSLKSVDPLGRESRADALLVHFSPGIGRLFQLKMNILKVLWIFRQGDFRRVFRAVLKRAPVLKPLLRHFL